MWSPASADIAVRIAVESGFSRILQRGLLWSPASAGYCSEDRIERRAGAHRLRRQSRIRMVVAADVHGSSLDAVELANDAAFVLFKIPCDRCKRLAKRGVGFLVS